jgi:hypothetical protein
MAYEPAMSGEVPVEGMLDVLRQIEERRISGRLRFTAKNEKGQGETGEVELVAGQLALSQDPLPDGTDPVERLLVLRGGIFVVHQRLPVLAVSQGDDQNKRGSLAVHAPSDLMTYCENAGLTGTLRLINAGSLVDMIYEAGELLGIKVDGNENADLSHVFSWEDGRFEIGVGRDVRSLMPGAAPEDPSDREPTTQFVRPGANDTGQHFLKVLEVALTDIVDRRERAQHKGRNAQSAPQPSVRPRPPTLAPPRERKPRRDATVRVVILGNDDDAAARVIDQTLGRGKPSRAQEPAMAKKPNETPKTKAAEAATPASKPKDEPKAIKATEPAASATKASETKASETMASATKASTTKASATKASATKASEAKTVPEATETKPADPATAIEAKPAAETIEREPPERLGETALWAVAVFILGIGVLAALARLAT